MDGCWEGVGGGCSTGRAERALNSVPPVADALGSFRWLGDQAQRHDRNSELLHRIEMSLNAVGVQLPADFIAFYSWDNWLHDPDAGPLPSQYASYLAHYPQPAS